MSEPIDVARHNDSTLDMPDELFRALPAEAVSVLIRHRCQRWEMRRKRAEGGYEYFTRVYLPAAAWREFAAVVAGDWSRRLPEGEETR